MPVADRLHDDPVAGAGDLQAAILRVRRQIGELMRRRRVRLGLSQEQLAERVGFSVNYIAHLERGSRGISLGTLIRLARGLQTSLAGLLTVPRQARPASSRPERSRGRGGWSRGG